MGIEYVPDNPIIRAVQRSGYVGKEPRNPRCPVCGTETFDVYCDEYGEVVGCDGCLMKKDAWDVPECLPDNERWD